MCTAPIAGSMIGEVLSCVVDGLVNGTVYFFEVTPFRGTVGVDALFGPRSNTAGGATLP
jgi:hypothetical protein